MARSRRQPQRECFVLAPIGERGSAIREHSDQLVKFVIDPVVADRPRHFKAPPSDHLPEPGLITNQIIERIVDAPLVIAVLTNYNPNVFYELALRHGLGKPVVQMLTDGLELPFDVKPMRTVLYDLSDPDRIEEAKHDLGRHIDSIEAGAGTSLDNPLSVRPALTQTRSRGGRGARARAELRAQVTARRG